MLHHAASGGSVPRILFVPNWPVAPPSCAAGRQSPDYYPADGLYWFFRHFRTHVTVDVLDNEVAWWPAHLEERALHFYPSQGLVAAHLGRRYDLVFAFGAQSAVGILAAWRLQRCPHPPVVVDDAGCLNAGRPERRLSFEATRWAMREAHLIVWHARASRDLCREACPELAVKGEYVPFGVCLDDLSEAKPRDGDYAICAGNSPREWESLADAWRAFPDRRLVLLGPRPKGKAPLPRNVQTVPRLPFREYVDLLAGARVVLLPLPDGWASWGQMTLLQAMALGKPVVVTNVRPVRDYVAKGCVTVPTGDAGVLLEAASSLWEDAALRATWGEAARRAVTEKFDERIMARRFEEIIVAALKS